MEQSRKQPRKQPPAELERVEFHERFARSFTDARFDGLRDAVAALEELAWRQYCDQHRPGAAH
ncbi:hypothetical protein [Duganella sp. Root336D2]|uniref:hypothetical protein n=1 Tax=Duganella sp. Root336D2 TaxID=1736518 RepID=UPI0006F38B9C|nr:hypothetical protein [Duganella sp. Root336D2]KQV61388.1 hypothetical protein ASD07_00525 [Duganella sp. Root336D2]